MKKSSLALLVALVLAGCAPLGKYKPVTEVPSDLYGTGVDTTEQSLGRIGWKDFFQDPDLQALISEALDANLDMKIALEYITRAEAALSGAKLSYVPYFAIAPEGYGAFSKGNNPAWVYNIAANASWEVDIFGRNANRIRSAKASLELARDQAQATRVSLISGVANLYYTLLMLDSELRTSLEMEQVWKKSVETILEIKREGFADEVAVNQYQATYAGIKATSSDLRNSIRQTENAMAILLGRPSMTVRRGTLETQPIVLKVSAGVPVDMLTYRPDVRAAQRNVEVAFYTTKDAWLNFFPTLSIGGSASLTNYVNGSIVPMSFLANLSAGLVAPIFNRGINRTNLKIAESRQREARILFDKTLYEAGIEVNDAMSDYLSCTEKALFYLTQVKCLLQAREDTELLMNNSNDKTYIDVLMAHNALIDAEFALISNRAQRLRSVVNLYAALGGGAE